MGTPDPVAIPFADPLPLPAPAWLLWGLLMLTFFLHILPMNFVLGGSLIGAVSRIRGGDDNLRLARWIGKLMPTTVAAAITFGVAPLLFVQALYGRLFFSSSVLMAWLWFAVIPILIVAYYGSYVIAFGAQERPRTGLALVTSVLFLAIAFMQTTNMSMLLRPEGFLRKYLGDRGGLNLNLSDPTFLPRLLHMVLGAAALAGLCVAIYGLTQRDAAHSRWAIRKGALWFSASTGINVLAGFWWMGALPRQVLMRFMGQSAAATVWLGVGIVTGVGTLAMMLLAGGAKEPRKLLTGSIAGLLLTLVAMLFARDQVRQGMLEIAGFRLPEWVEPQWGVIAIFATLLLAALGATVWMISLLYRAAPESP